MGRIVDNTHSRYGKARPWFVRMILPAAACTILAFWQPAGLTGSLQLIYMFLTYNLAVTICNTAIAVPEQSLISYSTLNAKSRSYLGGMHMLGVNVIVALVVTSNFLKVSEAVGGGDAYTQKGFGVTVAACMVMFAVLSGICFFTVRERVSNIGDKDGEKQEHVPVKKVLGSLFTNKYWLICTGMLILVYILMGATSGTTVYYTGYVVNNLDLQGSITSVYTLTMLAALVITIVAIIGKLGKRNTIILGMGIACVGYFMPILTHTSLMLQFGGFSSEAATQSASAVSSITFMFAIFPTIICAAILVLAFLYDLDGAKYSAVEKAIKEGKIGDKRDSEL